MPRQTPKAGPRARRTAASKPAPRRARPAVRKIRGAGRRGDNTQPAPAPAGTPERIQKVLAQAGFGSRREIEEWIRAGKIEINGVVAKLGDHANASDTVRVAGKIIPLGKLTEHKVARVLVYHKPVGEICTRDDPEGRPTVFTRLPRLRGARWIVVGRLDVNTSGLLLFTTDGDLAQRLMHPKHEIEREYAVRVFGDIDAAMLQRLSTNVLLEDGPAKFESIIDAGGSGRNHWYHVILTEGRNREVRRLWESQGVTVSRLIRLRFGPILLPKGLREGQCRELETEEVAQLQGLQGGVATNL
ncbi:MAG: 23S rRNA pseudouridine(2605) synthase RluB [Pseudomonadota bacterium]